MVSESAFRELALSFPDTIEMPHFERTSFRVNKKIFVTLDVKKQIANCKLNIFDQEVFCSADSPIVHPVDNKWGLQGWTAVHLQLVSETTLRRILTAAFGAVANKPY